MVRVRVRTSVRFNVLTFHFIFAIILVTEQMRAGYFPCGQHIADLDTKNPHKDFF